MAAPSVKTIGNAKPVATGGIRVGPLNTTLPTDTSTAPSEDLAPLGYVNEDGLRPEGERSTETVRDWGGDVIAQLQTEHASRFTFTLYGVFDADVLRAVFGDDNVEETGGVIHVKETGDELPHVAWMFDMRSTGGKKIRITIEDGQVTTVAEGALVAGSLQSFEVTVEAFVGSDGVKVHRYYESEADSGDTGRAVPAGAATPVPTLDTGGDDDVDPVSL